jgi:hypothetical protein
MPSKVRILLPPLKQKNEEREEGKEEKHEGEGRR